MRLPQTDRPLSCLALALLAVQPIKAIHLPRVLRTFEDLQDVRKRCDNPCGYYGQLCCESGESCYTDANNQAQCGPAQQAVTAAAGGVWEYYTTTYVQTDLKTVTATFSSLVSQGTGLSCSYSLGETPCGNVCCKSGQYCQASGMCLEVGGGSSGYYSSLFTVTTVVTNTASAPLRPTSNTQVTVTTGVTTTAPFQSPVGTNGAIITGPTEEDGGGLSGGAIAGIVIGVIAGIILLLLICACMCFKGLIDGILAIFGLGSRRKRRTEEEVYVERHSRHGSRHGSRNNKRTWFGTRPARSDGGGEKRTGIGRAGWIAATLGGLALFLGLKRRNRRDDKTSTVGSSYYSDYSTSSSESSSDRRTRRSSRSRSRR